MEGNHIMLCAILVCLIALGCIALAKPLQLLFRFLLSAAAGGVVLFLGQSLGAAVGINCATLLVAGLLGLPGVAGIFLLSFFL